MSSAWFKARTLLAAASIATLTMAGSAALALNAYAAKPAPYSPTLSVTWPTAAGTGAASGTPYVVSGCGYDSSYGGVTIVVQSPQAVAFAGQMPDSTGCISLSNFSTQGPGHYEIDAWQALRNKSVIVASTSFDL